MDRFDMFDEFDNELIEAAENKAKSTNMADVLKEHPELSSVIPKCELGLECDNCGFCH